MNSFSVLKIREIILQGYGEDWNGYGVILFYSIITLLSLSFSVPILSRYPTVQSFALPVDVRHPSYHNYTSEL